MKKFFKWLGIVIGILLVSGDYPAGRVLFQRQCHGQPHL